MTQPAAGWYPDPHDPNLRRYFDGARWTEHAQPVAPPSGAPGPPPGQPAGPITDDRGIIHARGMVVGAGAPLLSGTGGDGIVRGRGMVITPGEPARVFAMLALFISLSWSLGIGSLAGLVLAIIALRRGEEPITRGIAYGALVTSVIGLSVTISLAVWWFALR